MALGDRRQFTYSLRPRTADIKAFPPVALSYFDVDRERYVTLRTEPIPLRVAAARQLADGEIAMARPKPASTVVLRRWRPS